MKCQLITGFEKFLGGFLISQRVLPNPHRIPCCCLFFFSFVKFVSHVECMPYARGGTLNVEVIGMLVGNSVLENAKKYPDFDFKPLKIPELQF